MNSFGVLLFIWLCKQGSRARDSALGAIRRKSSSSSSADRRRRGRVFVSLVSSVPAFFSHKLYLPPSTSPLSTANSPPQKKNSPQKCRRASEDFRLQRPYTPCPSASRAPRPQPSPRRPPRAASPPCPRRRRPLARPSSIPSRRRPRTTRPSRLASRRRREKNNSAHNNTKEVLSKHDRAISNHRCCAERR